MAYSVDGGTTWRRLVSLTGSESTGTYTNRAYDLSVLAANAGVTLGSDVRIRFQQYDDQAIPNDGMAFDAISLTTSSPTP